jgi:hypothetical protein
LALYHSLDQPLQLRVISRSGWGDLCEDAIAFERAALAVLTGCAKNPKAVIPSYYEKFLRDKSQYEPIVEKDYWAAMPVLLCTKPAPKRGETVSLLR